MSSTNVENDIVVAGAGIAAAAVAGRLIEFGFRPFLLSRGLPCQKGIEAIPESALRLFDALELTPALQSAGGVLVEGFENAWRGGEPVSQPGRYVHVERTSLARAAIAAVIDRGAILVHCNTLPPLNVEREWVRTLVDGAERRFTAAIDATGRSARWSRPIRRQGSEFAEIFSTDKCSESLLRGRIARISGGWGYRLGLPDAVTVGVVTPHGTWQGQVNDLITASLCLPQTQLRRMGRRPAFPQWAEEPIRDRRLAVGDAALAYNPIAGQGIRLALSSTLAAAAVIRTWRDSPDDKDYATQFYRDLVNTERLKHLSFLNSLYTNEPLLKSREPPGLRPLEPSVSGTSLPSMICYSGQTRMTGLHINGLIKCSEALTLPDGNMVRWLGSFDLLTLRELCKAPLPTATLVAQLGFERLSQAQALSLVQWCLERNILSPYEPTLSGCFGSWGKVAKLQRGAR